MNLEVIYEDNHLIAVNKPAGLVVQDNEHGLASLEHHVKSYIKEKYNKVRYQCNGYRIICKNEQGSNSNE